MPKILSEEERQKSKEKRQEYLKKWREEHGMEYYTKNKGKIIKQAREKREKEKGSPLNSYTKVNLKDMTKEEKNAYYREKNKKCRAKKKESKKTENIFDKNYYIVDCENFTYFARKVRVIGISSGGYNDEIEYITNLPHPFVANEHRSMYFNEITRFKTFEQAQRYAKKLNNISENKQRKKRWMQDAFSQKTLELKYLFKEEY